MIYHVSIPAREPQHVAKVLAELMVGECHPFGPLDGGHIAGALHSMNDPSMSAQRAQVLWSTIAVAAVLFVLWLAAGHALAAVPR